MLNADPSVMKSHPAIRFTNIPIVRGPLNDFSLRHPQIVEEVIERSLRDFQKSESLDFALEEAVFVENRRIRSHMRIGPGHVFTLPRTMRDRALLREVKGKLRLPPPAVDRRELTEKILRHYAEEICGNFRPSVYRLAVHLVPWMASWLLNAASVRHFSPWNMPETLESRLRILGEVTQMQNLCKKGTVLMVPTHQSNIDSMLIGYVIYLMSLPPFAYGAGLNLYTNPLLGFFMNGLGAYTVDREKIHSLYKTTLKNYSTTILKQGVHSIFFTGGGRSRSGAIESHLKLGLLGTGLQAQLENLRENKPNGTIYIVPMVVSYDFVLEASSLIDHYLSQFGKQRFIGVFTEQSLPIIKGLNFLWKFFSSESGLTVRIGRAMDVFGNPVDDDGHSIGPNGTAIDRRAWLTSEGQLKEEPQRDAEYIRRLGTKIVDSYYRENVVVCTHVVAFAFFRALRRKYPDMDLFRFLRLSREQRSLAYEVFLSEAKLLHTQLLELENKGKLHLCQELKSWDLKRWVEHGVKHLGVFHESAVMRIEDAVVSTEDMSLLYYYRNRLSGYDLSLAAERGQIKLVRGQEDEQGFLV